LAVALAEQTYSLNRVEALVDRLVVQAVAAVQLAQTL
jgi:hypothetical protein